MNLEEVGNKAKMVYRAGGVSDRPRIQIQLCREVDGENEEEEARWVVVVLIMVLIGTPF